MQSLKYSPNENSYMSCMGLVLYIVCFISEPPYETLAAEIRWLVHTMYTHTYVSLIFSQIPLSLKSPPPRTPRLPPPVQIMLECAPRGPELNSKPAQRVFVCPLTLPYQDKYRYMYMYIVHG